MELSIRISSEDFKKLDLEKAMDNHYIRVEVDALLMSMHMTDGAIDEALEKAENWDNIPDDILAMISKEQG